MTSVHGEKDPGLAAPGGVAPGSVSAASSKLPGSIVAMAPGLPWRSTTTRYPAGEVESTTVESAIGTPGSEHPIKLDKPSGT